MDRLKGIAYSALSSATFGLAPFFTVSLIHAGYSSCETLSYRWGIATVFLVSIGLLGKTDFRLSKSQFFIVLLLSIFRAATSFSLVIAYQNIASGAASVIHFMYPLAVALTMMSLFKEAKSKTVVAAIAISIAGAALLASGSMEYPGGGSSTLGTAAACVSIFSYAGYIIGVRKTKAADIPSVPLTCYVMGFGALFFIFGGLLTGGIRIETEPRLWICIAGLSLVATAVSNITLVQGIKLAGPTLASVMGAMEPLTAVVIGVSFLHETFTLLSAAGMLLIISSVLLVVMKQRQWQKP